MKIIIFLFSKNPLFFSLSWGIVFLGYESDRYVKKLHFFSIFRIFIFWPLLTQFWVWNARFEFVIFCKFQIGTSCFLLKTRSKVVKTDQNLRIRKIEKMHFVHVSITIVAQELDSPAQIADWEYFGFLNFLRPLLPLFRGVGFKIHAQFEHHRS